MVMVEGTAVLRWNRLGTKQCIQQNIRADCSNIDKILEPPEGQDENIWNALSHRMVTVINNNPLYIWKLLK
uniref:Uncharacterized protein n=1 Tax=Cebus imitator TaxID=2715852 RepID=A0A2K5Q4H3_CEBIM